MSKKILSGSIIKNPTNLQRGSVTDQLEDRSAFLRSEDEVIWTGAQLQFTADIVLEIVNTSNGVLTEHIIEASNSPLNIADGEAIYVSIDRSDVSEIVTPVNSGVTPIPAHSQSNKDIFVLFKRINAGSTAVLHIPFHKQAIRPGVTFYLGETGGSSAGGLEFYEQTLNNNQVAPSNITDFVVDKLVDRGFNAEYTIVRRHEEPAVLIEDAIFQQNFNQAVKVANARIVAAVEQADGKVLLGGAFTTYGGLTRNRLVRLNSDGTEDTAFYTNLGTGFNGLVQVLALQSDGKIIVGGNFTSLNGNTRNRLVRLNSDGTEDVAFYINLGTGFNLTVYALAIQPDNKIIVGGQFDSLNGNTRNRLVRLNSDGTEDTAFYTNLGTGFNNIVYALAIQPDNKIIVGGNFGSLNGNIRNFLVRLNLDGTEDTAFYTNLGTGFDVTVRALALQSDGKIIVGGSFTSLNGNTRNGLVRLNSDGTEDTAFYTNLGTGITGSIFTLVIQPDEKILLGGDITAVDVNGPYRGLARLNSDGTEDNFLFDITSYIYDPISGSTYDQVRSCIYLSNDTILAPYGWASNTSSKVFNIREDVSSIDTVALEDDFQANLGTLFNNSINVIKKQPDGKYLVGGSFTSLNGNTRNRLVRLNSDGTEDVAFYTNLGTGFNNQVYSIDVLTDGDIIVGGQFTDLNGNTRNRLVRLNSDGTEDGAFYTNLGTAFNNVVWAVLDDRNNGILVGGDFTDLNGSTRNRLVRLNADGTEDSAFYTNLGTGFADIVRTLALVYNDLVTRIVVGGNFATFNSNTRNYLTRINLDGTEDAAFYTNLGTGFNGIVRKVAIQNNQLILVGGQFTDLNGNTRNRLVRLNFNGTEDAAFYTNLGTAFDADVHSIIEQPDERIVVGGNFLDFNGNGRQRIVRLNADGTEDTDFYTDLVSGFDGIVNALELSDLGRILTGGAFTNLNSVSANYFAALNSPDVLTELIQQGTVKGYYRLSDDTWNVGGISYFGDDTEVTFSMTNTGQMQYTSSNIPGTVLESVIKYTVIKV